MSDMAKGIKSFKKDISEEEVNTNKSEENQDSKKED